MRIRTKEEMRVYQRARRARFRNEGKPSNWKRGIIKVEPKVTIEALKILRRDTIPLSVNGYFLYFLFAGDEVVYIGQSRSLLQRIISHKQGNGKKEFNSIALIESTKDKINEEEYGYIKWYSPKYNKAGLLPEVIDDPSPVTPCPRCLPIVSSLIDESDKVNRIISENELLIKKLQDRVAFLEKSMERYAIMEKPTKSSYRLGPEFSRL